MLYTPATVDVTVSGGKYCKTFIFGGHFYFALFAVYRKITKYETRKYRFEYSYTISNKWTHILSMLVSVSINQLSSSRVIFNVNDIMSANRLLFKERICSP